MVAATGVVADLAEQAVAEEGLADLAAARAAEAGLPAVGEMFCSEFA